jgi:hypothetical protein
LLKDSIFFFLGVYQFLFEKFSNKDGSPPGFFQKAGLGMSAGACGAFIGTPAEIALIRMTADGNLPAAERRYDNHVMLRQSETGLILHHLPQNLINL